MRNLRYTSLAVMVTASVAVSAAPQAPEAKSSIAKPDFRLQVWGDAVADFTARVQQYFELRRTAEDGLQALAVTDDPADITRAEVALATRIRLARGAAKEGEIFTPAIAAEFRKALVPELDAQTRAVIADDNPGEFSRHINGTYPKRRAYSTVPANILALLPRLPDDIQYRFLGRHLILHDTRANIILDLMPCAIKCRN